MLWFKSVARLLVLHWVAEYSNTTWVFHEYILSQNHETEIEKARASFCWDIWKLLLCKVIADLSEERSVDLPLSVHWGPPYLIKSMRHWHSTLFSCLENLSTCQLWIFLSAVCWKSVHSKLSGTASSSVLFNLATYRVSQQWLSFRVNFRQQINSNYQLGKWKLNALLEHKTRKRLVQIKNFFLWSCACDTVR
jgi:hypothetical protein